MLGPEGLPPAFSEKSSTTFFSVIPQSSQPGRDASGRELSKNVCEYPDNIPVQQFLRRSLKLNGWRGTVSQPATHFTIIASIFTGAVPPTPPDTPAPASHKHSSRTRTRKPLPAAAASSSSSRRALSPSRTRTLPDILEMFFLLRPSHGRASIRACRLPMICPCSLSSPM